jgi:glycosyltransferase involved in cell wall biosynthesis
MRILWLKTELLHPVDKGGKIRTYQMLKALKRHCQLTYITLDDGASDEKARCQATEYCDELICVPHRTYAKFSAGFYTDLARNVLSPLPYTLQKYASPEMKREIARCASTDRFDIIISDFLTPSVNLPERIDAPCLLFQHNVEAKIWQRHYETAGNALKRAFLYRQWRKTFDYERAACRRFQQVVAVSAEDEQVMRREYGADRVAAISTGVDTGYFRPAPGKRRDPLRLLFVGSMDWLPNDDAVRYFTEAILPRIRAAMPSATLTVVGRNPYPGLLALSRRDPAIQVTGRVDDVRPYMEEASVFVVPIRIGGGTRLKIYEAMAMELPVVSTFVGAEGLEVRDGTDLLLADTPDRFADAVVGLLQNPDRAAQLGRHGAETVRTQFGWDHVADQFLALCRQTVQSCDAPEQAGAWPLAAMPPAAEETKTDGVRCR